MIAEILSTGDEIRSGSLVDSNSAWLSRKLEERGITVSRHSCVGDDIPMLVSVFREIGARAHIAMVTGGLGPTTDDLSAEAAGKAAGLPLLLNETALCTVRKYFSSRNREMPASNRKQAMLPRGADMLPNSAGTAPGFAMQIGKCRFFFMPGVPSEMRRMFREQVLPRLEEMQGDNREIHQIQSISTFGMPESAVGELVKDLPDIFPHIRLGLRAKFPEIQIRLYGRHDSRVRLQKEMEAAQTWVREKMGTRVFSGRGESMEAVVGRLLREKNATLALAESCTGGLIASRITDVAGSSEYFLFSAVTYSNEAKMRVLGVKSETLEQYGAVSEETVKEMAEGAGKLADADYGIATSGIAGPDGGSEEKPVGTLCVGLAGPDGIKSFRFLMKFADRSMNKSMFAMKALDLLRMELINT
ncbi:MAG: competence/damage-inducible protein A [Desulfococcaceae bacterium]|jgi:nicotinamide-nucleotide amidase|nr:competence/damage-inducible protein A [Desulfococcaceae bacterium]